MKAAATEAVVETTETAIETVAEKTGGLTPKNLIIAAGATLVVVGVFWGVKKLRERAEEETE